MQVLEASIAHTPSSSNRACDRCRRLKAKCDSVDYICTNCTKVDRGCTFHIPPGKRGPKGKPRRTIARREPVSEVISAHHSFTSATDAEQSLAAQNTSPLTPATSQIFTVLPRDLSTPIPNPTSSTCHLWQSLSAIITTQVSPKTFEAIVRQCTDLYFDYISPCTVLVDETSFRLLVEHAFLPDATPPLPQSSFALITALCAKVCFFLSSDLFAEGQDLGDFFLKTSRAILLEYHEEDLENPNGESIAIRYLQSNCLHTSARQKISWHVFGETVRLIQGMRLHDEASYSSLPPLEAELRRRAFWQVYVGDKSMAMLKSMPSVLHKLSFDKGITVDYPSAENDEDIVAFNTSIRMWESSSNLLLHLRAIQDRQRLLPHNNATATIDASESTHSYTYTYTPTDRALIDHLHLTFLTTLDSLRAHLQPGAAPSISDPVSSTKQAKHLAIQTTDLQSTYHTLKLHILQTLEAAHYFSPPGLTLPAPNNINSDVNVNIDSNINVYKGMLIIRKTEIAQDMLRFMREAPFWCLQVCGEPCVEKIRLTGASLLAIMHDTEASSPLLAERARRDVGVLLDILTKLDSRASIALREGGGGGTGAGSENGG